MAETINITAQIQGTISATAQVQNLVASSGDDTLSVGFTLSADSGDDETEITATATGDAGTEYIWTLNEGTTYEKFYSGSPASIKFNKHGINTLKLTVINTSSMKYGESEDLTAYTGTIMEATRHIDRCADIKSAHQTEFQDLIAKMKNNPDVWDACKVTDVIMLPCLGASQASGLKEVFPLKTYAGDLQYIDRVGWNSPIWDEDTAHDLNGVDQHIDFENSGAISKGNWRIPRGQLILEVVYQGNTADGVEMGWYNNANSNSYMVLTPAFSGNSDYLQGDFYGFGSTHTIREYYSGGPGNNNKASQNAAGIWGRILVGSPNPENFIGDNAALTNDRSLMMMVRDEWIDGAPSVSDYTEIVDNHPYSQVTARDVSTEYQGFHIPDSRGYPLGAQSREAPDLTKHRYTAGNYGFHAMIPVKNIAGASAMLGYIKTFLTNIGRTNGLGDLS